MAVLIDSSVFIALERGHRAIETLVEIVPGDQLLALAAITASELLTGVHRADTAQRRARRQAFVETVLEAVPVVPFDLLAARTHAELWARLAAAGTPIGAHDLLIAATAVSHGYGVLTDNVRHFERVPGLEVHQPSW